MKFTSIAALVAVLVAVALASRVVFEESTGVFPHWQLQERVSGAEPMKLTFFLKLRNVDELERVVLDVSHPDSANYGKHLTLAQVDDLTAPLPAQRNAVARWIHQNGGVQVEVTPSNIVAYFSAAKVEELFQCELHFFYCQRLNMRVVRSVTPYSMPAAVGQHVAYIAGMRRLWKPKPLLRNQPSFMSQSDAQNKVSKRFALAVDPSVIRSKYNVGSAVGQAANNSQAVVQFLGQYADSADLDEFFLLFAQGSMGTKPTFVGTDGWFPGIEASLDVEYIMGVGTKIPTAFWSLPNNDTVNQDPFGDWIQLVSTTANPPNIFSVSYGESEYGLPGEYLDRINQEFMKQGARGISILFASGDSGVDCAPTGTSYSSDFPVDSPYVTAVGGTQFDLWTNSAEVVNPLSGGGFSNYYPQPSWQAAAVSNYLSTNKQLPLKHFYNATGRAYPDVAALSSEFVIVIGLLPEPGVAGTSCASPTTAAVLALVNDLRIQAGKSPLGYLNPLIYSKNGAGWTDVTSGNNWGSTEGEACNGKKGGFYAQAGWDPASGWGSPDYSQLSTLAMSLP